ncbi:hypothetical protein BH10BAC5_BH10BAC5_03260 [soil metagenome]
MELDIVIPLMGIELPRMKFGIWFPIKTLENKFKEPEKKIKNIPVPFDFKRVKV